MYAQRSTPTASRPTPEVTAVARSQVYLLLARGFAYPRVSIQEPLERARQAAQMLGDDTTKLLARIEVRPPLELETEYIHAFGHTMRPDYPAYEMEYGQGHVFMQSHSMADLASFYRAFGAEAASGERLDHIGTELEFMYFLSYKEGYALATDNEVGATVCRDGQRRFLEKHLGRWAPLFLGGLEIVADGWYRTLAATTVAWLEMEAAALDAHPKALGQEALRDAPLSSSLFPEEEGLSPCDECDEDYS